MMTDFQDFAHQVGLHTMDMSSPALPMPQLNREPPPPAVVSQLRLCDVVKLPASRTLLHKPQPRFGL